MRDKQTNTLLILFGTSFCFAISGLAMALFGGIKEILWLLSLGMVLAALSIVISVYANRSLDRILKGNYNDLTKRIDMKFAEARRTLDRISQQKEQLPFDQKTNPGRSQEQ
ncbi:MAG: hypothetical protein WC527_06310 [Candidatus Margulisiibacteriota bacterium]